MAIDVARSLAKMAGKRAELLAMPHGYAGADVKSDIAEAIAEQFQAEVRTLVSLVMQETYTQETDPVTADEASEVAEALVQAKRPAHPRGA